MLTRKKQHFEVQLLCSRIEQERQRTFPKDYCGELPAMLEAQMASLAEAEGGIDGTERPGMHVRRNTFGSKNLLDGLTSTSDASKTDASSSTSSRVNATLGAAPSLPAGNSSVIALSKAHEREEQLLETNAALEQRLRVLEAAHASPHASAHGTQLVSTSPMASGEAAARALVPFRRRVDDKASRSRLENVLQCAPWMREVGAGIALELELLSALCSVNAEDEVVVGRAVKWCEEHGAASIDEVVDAPGQADAFVAALGLLPIPAQRLRAALQPTSSFRNAAGLLAAAVAAQAPSSQEEGAPAALDAAREGGRALTEREFFC